MDDQATAGFRIGQRRRVQARKFVGTGAGTLEKRIDQLIEGVEVLANMVVGDGESWPTELSTTRLGELFALPKEAIGEGASRLALLSGVDAPARPSGLESKSASPRSPICSRPSTLDRRGREMTRRRRCR